MSVASKQVLEELSKRGYRVTEARERIVNALAQADAPLSVQALASRVLVDEASVYRTIKLLVEEELVEEITIVQERPHYALSHGHHHHVVCTGCGLIEHVPCHDIPRSGGFENFAAIERHEVTYYGVCKTCHS